MVSSTGWLFVQTNDPQNAVIAFRRDGGGSLTRAGTYATGGAGSGEPFLTSQGSVTLAGDGRHLLVTNTASGDVTLFAVVPERGLELVGSTPAAAVPTSVTEHDGLVYVLGTGESSVVGFRLVEGHLEPLAGATRILAAGADPAQVGVSADGTVLIVTDRATDSILVFAVGRDGSLGTPATVPSSGRTPYGFACTSGGTLVVTEAFGAEKGAAAASSYAVANATVTPITASVGNGRSEICWAVVTPDGRHAFTTNFADGAVSRYGIDLDGTLTLEEAAAGLSVDGRTGLRDEDMSADGHHLYAIDANAGSVYGWAVDDRAHLTPIGSWGGLPPTVAGLAVH